MKYEEGDLRAEAARQHAERACDADFMGVGEMMQDAEIASLTPQVGGYDIDGQPVDGEGPTWGALPEEDFDAAHRKIHDLIGGAVDTSQWAVDLGADGLDPDSRIVQIHHPGGRPLLRAHFAFDPELSDKERERLLAIWQQPMTVKS